MGMGMGVVDGVRGRIAVAATAATIAVALATAGAVAFSGAEKCIVVAYCPPRLRNKGRVRIRGCGEEGAGAG